MLFSDIQRTDSSPKRYSESAFAHLNRRAREDYDRIRALVEQWFSHIPSGHQHEIHQRIRCGNDLEFHSAFLELYTHELLLETGHHVEIHPDLACTSRRPDFMATATDSSTTIIECAVATEETVEERNAQARLNTFFDAINELHSLDYFLNLSIEGNPETSVPERQWRAEIRRWIETLNYDEIVSLWQQQLFDELPKLKLSHEGLVLTVEPIPKKQSARGKFGVRPIGAQLPEACWVTSRFEIGDSIKKKAKRYGDPKQPYVVVVNCIGVHADQEEVEEALYGRDGVWSPKTSPLFTRLSGVAAIHHLFPWSVPRADICLFHNPHASFPYTSTLTALPQARLIDGNIDKSDGIHPRESFGLAMAWPKDEGVG
jgi:hypothetical protein